MKIHSRLALVLQVLFLMLPAMAARADGDTADVVEAHGFKIYLNAADQRQRKVLLASLERQFEIIDSARLPEDVVAFMRLVPIIADNEIAQSFGEYANRAGSWAVRVRPTTLPRDRPILLHEMLHAFHHQVLMQPTPFINQSFAQAKQSDMYPRKYRNAHFLENPREYFAVIGSIFLFGRIDQPPFDCKITAKEQPQFLAYLAQHLGPHECR